MILISLYIWYVTLSYSALTLLTLLTHSSLQLSVSRQTESRAGEESLVSCLVSRPGLSLTGGHFPTGFSLLCYVKLRNASSRPGGLGEISLG